MKVLSLAWVHIRRLKKMKVMPSTDYNSNDSIHAWQVGPDTYCSLLLPALFHWGPHPLGKYYPLSGKYFLPYLPSHTSVFSTHLVHAPGCVFCSHVPQSAQVKVHNEPPQPPYFHFWHPHMIISPSPEFPLFSWYGRVHHEFFCVL